MLITHARLRGRSLGGKIRCRPHIQAVSVQRSEHLCRPSLSVLLFAIESTTSPSSLPTILLNIFNAIVTPILTLSHLHSSSFQRRHHQVLHQRRHPPMLPFPDVSGSLGGLQSTYLLSTRRSTSRASLLKTRSARTPSLARNR